jgi:hypothetical protein
MLRRLPGRVIEGKLRLSSVWGKPSPPSAISLYTLREFTLPDRALLHPPRGEEALLGRIDTTRARIRTYCEILPRGDVREFFPGRRTDREG